MSFLFGDATLQTPADVASVINYNPQRQLGSGSGNYMANTMDSDQTSEQVASQTKKDEMTTTASVGVGVGGGSGSGGTVSSQKSGDVSELSFNSKLKSYLPYIITGGAVILSAGFFIFRKKKK